MSIEILSIRDENIRKVAEIADSGKGKLAYNGKLDANEVNVFMIEAEKLDCRLDYILGSVDQAGVNLESSKIKERIKKLGTIYEIKNNIKRTLEQKDALPSSNSKILGITFGAGLGFSGGVLLVASLLSGLGTIPSLGVLTFCTFAGGTVGNQIGKNLASHEEKCAEKQRVTLDNKIEHYQKVLEELRLEFQN